MLTSTRAPARQPRPSGLVLPFKHPPVIDPSCVLALLPQWDDKWVDYSGHGNHGIVHGARPTAKGPHGFAYEFDGVDDFVNVGYGGPSNLINTLPLTIVTTINTRRYETTVPFNTAVSNDIPGHHGHGFGVGPHGSIKVLFHDGIRSTGTNLALNTWYVIAICYTDHNIETYVDGNIVDSFPYTPGPLDAANGLLIAHNWPSGGLFLNGLNATLHVYQRVFTADQIRELSQASRFT